MRKLMWFVLGYALGIAGAIWVLDRKWHLIYATSLFLLSLGLGLICSPGLYRKITSYIVGGIAVALLCFFIFDSYQIDKAREQDGEEIELEILVLDYGSVSNDRSYAIGEIQLSDTSHKLIFFLNEEMDLCPGDRVCGEFYLSYTGHKAEGGSTYFGEGIYLKAYATGDCYLRFEKEITFNILAAKLRHTLTNHIDNIFPCDVKGFARALLLGDSTGLSKAENNNFQNSGIRHIIAVSGLHISILFSFVHEFLGKRKYMTAIIGIPVLILFAALAGFTPSAVRACIMQILMIGSMLLNKQYDPPTSLAFAVLVILGADPLAMTSIGFQLSVASVLGIFLFSSKINRYITSREWLGKFSGKGRKARLKRMFASSASTSLSAMVFTIPLSAYYFGTVCTIGIISNLLTLWAVTYIFCGLIISIILSLVFAPLGVGAAWVLAWLMRYVLWISGLLAFIPFSVVSAENWYIVTFLGFSYLLVFIMLFSKEKKVAFLVGCLAFSFAVSILLSVLESNQDRFSMTVLDVGQGQCILLQSGDQCYIVDCGGTSAEGAADLAARTLRTQGIGHVDGLILTHYDHDHAGGVESLLSQISVDRLYLPDAQTDESICLWLQEEYPEKIEWVNRKDYLHLDHAIITLVPPENDAIGNNACTSILFQAENCDILITGDLQAKGEAHLMRSVNLPEVEILVAGHHGADDSTTMALLKEVNPATVVISVGEENNFGHPHISLLHRLEIFGCKVWRTDENGTITFRG